MFCSILQKPNNKGIIKVLRSVEVLRSLNIGQLQRLADTLSTVSFADGEHAIQQGDTGDEFFIITQGNVRLIPHLGFGYTKSSERPFFEARHGRVVAQVVCTVVTRDSAAPHEEVMRLGPNQYFGERALLGNARRAATVTACGRVECLSISREMFEEVIGPLQHIINADRRWRERSELQQQQGGTSARMVCMRMITSRQQSLWDCTSRSTQHCVSRGLTVMLGRRLQTWRR
jgi:CRP-like cAMP-binding protein